MAGSSPAMTNWEWFKALRGDKPSKIGEADPEAEPDRDKRADQDHGRARGAEQQHPQHKRDDRGEDAADQRRQPPFDADLPGNLGHRAHAFAAASRESAAVARAFFRFRLRKRVSWPLKMWPTRPRSRSLVPNSQSAIG